MNRNRLYFLTALILLFGAAIIGRFFSLQVLQKDIFEEIAKNQYQFYKSLIPERGEIYSQDKFGEFYPLAINETKYLIYAEPKKIAEKELNNNEITKLSLILGMDEGLLRNRIFKKDDPYEPLKHGVEEKKLAEIKNLSIKGIEFTEEKDRYYPNATSSSHVLGFLGVNDINRIGQYGIEGYYEDLLKGVEGVFEGEKDVFGRWIPTGSLNLKPAQNGPKIILTIDQNVQFFVEKSLYALQKKWNAKAGSVIVMEPKTGKILALANTPSFDPNKYNSVDNIDIFLDSAIQNTFEPGSVFKPITMAIAVDKGLVSPQTSYFDEGSVKVGGYVIKNVDGKSWGSQTMTQVLDKSLNTGAVFVSQLIDKNDFRKYVKDFGFSDKTGIDLSGETVGNISNLDRLKDIYFATASFGQGIAVTSIELISAISALANKGELMKPYIVDRIIYEDGRESVNNPEVIRSVVSSKTALRITSMMVSVIENGFGKPARIPGYSIAGKTGTAQVSDKESGGYSEETIHSFAAFAPAFDPKFIILMKLDEPQGIRFAADSLTKPSKEIIKYILDYYEIPPDS